MSCNQTLGVRRKASWKKKKRQQLGGSLGGKPARLSLVPTLLDLPILSQRKTSWKKKKKRQQPGGSLGGKPARLSLVPTLLVLSQVLSPQSRGPVASSNVFGGLPCSSLRSLTFWLHDTVQV